MTSRENTVFPVNASVAAGPKSLVMAATDISASLAAAAAILL
jgi:hypothetical protein